MDTYEFAWEAAAAVDLDSLIQMYELGYPHEWTSLIQLVKQL